MIANLRAVVRLMLFILWTVLLVPFQLFYQMTGTVFKARFRHQSPIVRLWYYGVLKIMSVRAVIVGDRERLGSGQFLYVSNHSSYVDILILGAYLPPFFIAKADTADWPVFGFLIKIGGTLFISRKRSALKEQINRIRQALLNGKSLFLFPEGTTSDGTKILPCKSSLLHVLYDDMPPLHVVPVCITYQAVNGQAFGESTKDHVAWYGDMDFAPHLWQLFRQKSVDAKVTVLPAMHVADYADAKTLTHQAEHAVTACFTANRSA